MCFSSNLEFNFTIIFTSLFSKQNQVCDQIFGTKKVQLLMTSGKLTTPEWQRLLSSGSVLHPGSTKIIVREWLIGNFEMNSVSKQATLFVGYKKPPIFLTDKSFYRFEKICNHSKFQKFTTRVLGNFVVPVVVPQHF